MKKKMLWILLAFATVTQAATPDSSVSPLPLLRPLPQESLAAPLAAEFLSTRHYKAVPLDAEMSNNIFNRYLKELDPEKMFFVQSDIDKLASTRDHLGEGITKGNLNIPFYIFNLYEQRMTERYTYARAQLRQNFDFTKKEDYELVRDKEPWAKSDDEIRDLWRKRVKNDWLRLKLAGKDQKSIFTTLDKRYENAVSHTLKLKSDDVFQLFMNAYAMSTDPHSNYFGVRATEDFDISMKLSLTGIGALLEEQDEYTTIRELIPGGPAALSGKLKVGDRITAIAQGEQAPMVDVMGSRLDDTVALIRGASDSTVVLDILPADAGPDGKHKLVALVRKKINLEQRAAKDSIIEVKEGSGMRRVGVISLPTFYEDFAARQEHDKDYKSATRDVAALLTHLKKEKVDSILIDLRNNGGGSLNEAIDLTGLFIKKGPVVQQRDSHGAVKIENSTNDAPLWDGPLGVLVNRSSASASEIFAAAIQDYGRGLIIGEPSFGKGTVQILVDLDQVAHNNPPKFGELKMTIAQFFRINGGTTQLRGVVPDISFPVSADADLFGESSFDNALPWTQIQPADYTVEGNISSVLPMLRTRHDARVRSDKDFQYIEEDIAQVKALRKKNMISLNEAERRKEKEQEEARIKLREKNSEGGKTPAEKRAAAIKDSARQDDGLQASERKLTDELAEEKALKDAKDVFLNEAVNILGDEADLLRTTSGLAAKVLPNVALGANAK